MTEANYVTDDDLMDAFNVQPGFSANRRLHRACSAGSRAVDAFCHRVFYPWYGTRTFDYPGPRASAIKLWLGEQELISADSVTSDGVTITGYFLRPDVGPPYDRVELDRDLNFSFAGGPQRAISITGLWGYSLNEVSASSLAAAITTTTQTTISVNTPAGGVGSVLRVGTERMIVTAKGWTLAGQTSPEMAAQMNVTTIGVVNGALWTEGEIILIDSERMRVEEIAGNSLTVKRAVQGSALASHPNGTQIYWQHNLVVERGALGTTAATALNGATVYRWEPPSLVSSLAQAYAEDIFLQENSGYARTAGQGDNERPVTGSGIRALESRVAATLQRKARKAAV